MQHSSGNNVYVASLPLELSDAELMNLFAPFGIVMSAKIMREHKTRQSKGYGFVLYRDRGSAESAIRALNNQVMGTTTLHVRHAHSSASQDLTKLCRPLPQCQQQQQQQQMQHQHHQMQQQAQPMVAGAPSKLL